MEAPLLLALVLAAGCAVTPPPDAESGGGRHPRAPEGKQPDMSPPRAPHDPWPEQAGAAWPRRCLIENVAVHPQEPWLTAACTHAEAEAGTGAVLLFDAQTGRVRSATHFDDYVGWKEDPDLLRWHPDGQRLTANVGTNGIALLLRGRVVGKAAPDETRDSGVRHVWVGDQIFSDTGALFEIRDGDELFPSSGALHFGEMQWNAAIGAVVGSVEDGIAAFDPVRKQVLYRVPGLVKLKGNAWSADGRWYAALDRGRPPASDRVRVYSGDDGRLRGTFSPSLPRIQELFWGRDGTLAVECDASARDTTAHHVDIVHDATLQSTIDLGSRRIAASHSVPEAGGLAWSPTGDRLALLLDGQEVRILDRATGKVLESFSARAPAVPSGLPAYYPGYSVDRATYPGDLLWLGSRLLVRLAPHFISFWSVEGRKTGELIVRD
jgi:hypothetical protein